METNDIYSFDSVKQYISGVIEIKQLLDQIKEKIAYRKEKKDKLLKAASENDIDLKEESTAKDVKEFLENDNRDDIDDFIFIIQKKFNRVRNRKPSALLIESRENATKIRKAHGSDESKAKKQKLDKSDVPEKKKNKKY